MLLERCLSRSAPIKRSSLPSRDGCGASGRRRIIHRPQRKAQCVPSRPPGRCDRTPDKTTVRFYATFLILLALPLGPDDTRAQLADSAQDTSAVDSALVARLQKEVDWRQLIRVRTDSTWVQLLNPSVSTQGIDYARLKVIELPPGGALPPRPIPLPAILAIEARQGNPKVGMIVGGFLGAGVVASVVVGLSHQDGGDVSVPRLGLGILFGGVTGVLLGSFLGEAMYSWQPVYVAEHGGERGPP